MDRQQLYHQSRTALCETSRELIARRSGLLNTLQYLIYDNLESFQHFLEHQATGKHLDLRLPNDIQEEFFVLHNISSAVRNISITANELQLSDNILKENESRCTALEFAQNTAHNIETSDLDSATRSLVKARQFSAQLHDSSFIQVSLEDLDSQLLDAADRIWKQSFVYQERSFLCRPTRQTIFAIGILNAHKTLELKFSQWTDDFCRIILDPLMNKQSLQESQDILQIGDPGSRGLTAIEQSLIYLGRSLQSWYTEVESGEVTLELSDLLHLFSQKLRGQFGKCLEKKLQDHVVRVYHSVEVEHSRFLCDIPLVLAGLETTLKSLGLSDGTEFSEFLLGYHMYWFDLYRTDVLERSRQVLLQWAGETENVVSATPTTYKLVSNLQEPLSQQAQEVSVTEEDSTVPSNELSDDWGSADWDLEEDIGEPSGIDPISVEARGTPEARDISSLKPLGNSSEVTFTISTMPRKLLDIIDSCRRDADSLDLASNRESPVQAAAELLRTLEINVLNSFKSLVPSIMKSTGYARMMIYNDCIFLANQVTDASLVRPFGESFYLSEISDKQDQVVKLLDRAEHFIACATSRQSQICCDVIQDVLDLLHRLQERYMAQLPETTLFMALGTLTDTALVYMVNSIMAMPDISEVESSELAKLGDRLSAVQDMFRVPDVDTTLVAMWCPSWFKVQLLLDILEAKLDYISELWNSGSLQTDFTTTEVTGLIRALFADSVKRNEAIQKIESTNRP